jgi:hypothetical protein
VAPRLDTVHFSELLSVPHTRATTADPLEMRAARTGYNNDAWQRYGDIVIERDKVWNSHAVFTRRGPSDSDGDGYPANPVPIMSPLALVLLAGGLCLFGARRLRRVR